MGFEDFPPLESYEAREVILLTMLFLLNDDLIRSIRAPISPPTTDRATGVIYFFYIIPLNLILKWGGLIGNNVQIVYLKIGRK